jgi:hypothetical protein
MNTTTTTTNDAAPWNTDASTEAPAPKAARVRKPKAAKTEEPKVKKEKVETRPVHVPVAAVKLAESEAKRTEAGLGETVAALITYALNRKAALAKHAAGAKAKPAKAAKKSGKGKKA